MCTSITFKTEDGSFIHGRTDEFGNYYRNDLLLFPRNHEFGNAILCESLNKFKSKYAILGTNLGTLFGEELSFPELINDGMNEAGLSFAEQYYPGCANYKVVESVSQNEIDFTILGRNALALFSSVDEVIEFIESYQGKIVVMTPQPAHYFFADKTGKTLVVEPDEPGYVTIYRKNNGIMTNSPNYSYHLLNLHQYVNMAQIDGNHSSAIKGVDGQPIFAYGTSGAFGLPGDTSPASRFVRASYLRDTTTRKDLITADDGVLRMFRLLNLFDVVPGMSLKKLGDSQGEGSKGPNANPVDFDNVAAGHTDHSDVKDLTNGRFFYNTQNNQSPRYVQFSDYDLDAKDVLKINMENDESIKYQKIILK